MREDTLFSATVTDGMITVNDIPSNSKSNMAITTEDFMYEKLSGLITDEHTSPEFIVLLWKELWAANEDKISAENRMRLLNLIIDGNGNNHGVGYLKLAASVSEDVIRASDNTRKVSNYKAHLNLLETLFIKTGFDSPAQVDNDTVFKLLSLFEDKNCLYWCRLITEARAFPIAPIIHFAINGRRSVQLGIKRTRTDHARQRAIEILSEENDEDFSSVPDTWLWSILKWDWMAENQFDL